MPKLLLKYHAAVLKEIPVEKTPLTIGRKPDNDIAIDNMAVSSHHARITMQGHTYMIEDLQSTNGTFLNEKRVISASLQHNDNILLGQHTLQFVYPESLQPAVDKPADTQETVMLNPAIQKEILAELATSAPAAAAAPAPSAPAPAAPAPSAPAPSAAPMASEAAPAAPAPVAQEKQKEAAVQPPVIETPAPAIEKINAPEPSEKAPLEAISSQAAPAPAAPAAAAPAAPASPPPAATTPAPARAAVEPPVEPTGPIGAPKSTVSGHLKVIEGKADKNEYQLTSLLTYIGKSETAAIKIKGFFAPDIAVLISKRPAGFLMTAVKDGYPKINNVAVSGQLELKDNDILEVGGIKFLFQIKPA